jgi:hypothetical protein
VIRLNLGVAANVIAAAMFKNTTPNADMPHLGELAVRP